MSLRELDMAEEDEPKHITIKRSTYYGMITAIALLVLFIGGWALIGYSAATSPKTICNYVIKHDIGDQDAQDGCYYKLAKEYEDIEYCNNIKNTDLQKECARVLGITQAY